MNNSLSAAQKHRLLKEFTDSRKEALTMYQTMKDERKQATTGGTERPQTAPVGEYSKLYKKLGSNN